MRAALLLFCLFFGSAAQANGYVGVNYARVSLPVASPTALEVKWGVQPNDIYSFELRAGRPANPDSGIIRGIGIEFETEYVGALARMGAFNERGGLYGIIGLMDMTIKLSTAEASDTHSETDLVFGLGAEFTANGLAVEYMKGTKGLEEIDCLSIGLVRRY